MAPSVMKVGYNIPFIRLVHKTENPINNLENIIFVCPPQILEATTYNESYANQTFAPLIPSNVTAPPWLISRTPRRSEIISPNP